MEAIKYILEFTFQDFWHFLGIWLLLATIFVNIGQIGNKNYRK